MKIERFSMGPMAANCYILLDEASGEAAVIDPGACEQPLIDYLQSDMIKKFVIFCSRMGTTII